jgi:integrase
MTKASSAGDIIRELKVGSFASLRKIEHGGTLQARRLSTGAVQLYWRYTYNGKTDRVVVGTYDPTAPPKSLAAGTKGFSLAAAAEACRRMATIQAQEGPDGGYREHLATRQRSLEAAKASKRQEDQYTLSKLMDAYTEYLEAKGRRSYADARSIFRLHVCEAFPQIAQGPAAAVTSQHVNDMLRRLSDLGKGRTANKLRAYMRAAYQCALDVHSLSSIPASFNAFHITNNPAATTKRDAAYDKADKRPLSLADLRVYWKLVKATPGIKGAALQVHLLTGGQRIEQLVRLRNADVRPDGFALFDAKGRPGQVPRRHFVPLTKAAASALDALEGGKVYVFSTDGGETALSAMTLSGWAKEIASGIADFQLKRVRSGVETALAAAGVSRDDRGHLQSHGQSGVQARHYDDYDYFKEKLEALKKLHSLLESPAPKRGATSKRALSV